MAAAAANEKMEAVIPDRTNLFQWSPALNVPVYWAHIQLVL